MTDPGYVSETLIRGFVRRGWKKAGLVIRLMRNLVVIALFGRPAPRAFAAAVKLCGRRLERRWPFLPKAEGKALNLRFEDLLEFQYARSPDFVALVVGAFDGVTNDPGGGFIRRNKCRAVFVSLNQCLFGHYARG